MNDKRGRKKKKTEKKERKETGSRLGRKKRGAIEGVASLRVARQRVSYNKPRLAARERNRPMDMSAIYYPLYRENDETALGPK